METLGIVPANKLYSPAQVGVAALLGAPAAAGWFISRNEAQLGRPHNGRRWFWGCVLGTVIIAGIGFFLPPRFPAIGLTAGYVAGCYQMAKQLQGNAVRDHLAAGGAQGSWWKVVCVGLIFLVAFMVAVFMLVLLIPAHAIG